jgi:plastocyanin
VAGLWWGAVAVGAGEVSGQIQLDGPRPEPVDIPVVAKSPKYPVDGCGTSKRSPRLAVSAEGGVANAVVWLQAATHAPAAPITATMDQQACEFMPHVLLVPRGSTVAIGSSDPILHNLRIFREAEMLMHEWQPPAPQPNTISWRFDEAGRFLVRCGVHAWMSAWIVVADHPYYAISDAEGNFTIPEAPPGASTLHVWHEALGEQQHAVVVNDHTASVVIRFPEQRRVAWESR